MAAIAAALMGGVVYLERDAGFAEADSRVLLPADLHTVPPDSDLAPGIAAFAGSWGGDRWSGGPSANFLVVERVSADGAATVVYAWGGDLEHHLEHGWWRVQGRIADGVLRLELPNGSRVEYSIGADGRLFGRDTDRLGGRRYVLLDRIQERDRAVAIAATSKRSDRLWREIDIPEHVQIGIDKGAHIELRATLYRVRSPGRKPLIILNHGSLIGTNRTDTYRFEEQARIFLSLGYSVLVPMRRGRGGSGGTFERDDVATPVTRIAAALEDIDTVVDAMKAEPFVDPDHVVMAGYERGGLLGLAYAARHPGKVAALLNFSGYWSPATSPEGSINESEFSAAGGARTPTLWLYAENDPSYPYEQAWRNFQAFKAAGGVGRFVAIPDAGDIPNYASRVFFWTATWEPVVSAFLAGRAEPAGAGMTLVGPKDPIGGGTMLGAIYYPAIEARDITRIRIWTIDALRDAPPRDGRFPLILLSPGYGGNRVSLHDIATGLARNGYIVVTVAHPGDDWRNHDAWRTDRVLVGREYDLRAALDAALADPVFRDRIDPNRIGVAGYSMGGYTALLLLGAQPDFARFEAYCRESPEIDSSCSTISGPPAIRPGLTFFRDARVKAGFLMAPGPGYFFTREGLRGVTAPIHIDDPALDEVLTRPFNAERIRDLLPAPPEYVLAPGVGHYIYSAPCPPPWKEAFPEACIDPPGADRAAFHAKLITAMLAFFKRTLAAH